MLRGKALPPSERESEIKRSTPSLRDPGGLR